MASVNFTTTDSSDIDYQVRIWFSKSHPLDVTKQQQGRVAVSSARTGDDGTIQESTLWYRIAGSSEAWDGDADGSNPSNPLPITTGTAGDLTALVQVLTRLKIQWRLDANGDVE